MSTWRGALREIERAAKRNARQKSYEEKQQTIARITENARNTLNQYENLINSAITLHMSCCESIDWDSIINSDPPQTVAKENHFEEIAWEKKQEFKPSRLSKLLGRTDKELSKLDEEIVSAKEMDEKYYNEQVKQYEKEFKKWEEEKELASRINEGEDAAIWEVLNSRISLKSNPYIGTDMHFHFEKGKLFEAEINVHKIDEIIPSFDLRQLKSGNLSKKDMPKTRRFELYKEYVCSATIRMAREIFALLPEEVLVVNAKCNQLNERTGYMEQVIILSAIIPRATLNEMNLQLVKPSLAIENFIHNIDYKKLSGFQEVKQVSI